VLSPATAQIDSIRSIVLPELAKAGIVEGRNLILDARAGSMDKLSQLAAELIAANPDTVMAVSGAAINAVRAASSAVPIVMSFSDYDPVTAGFALSFARPGGNITGIAMLATVLDAKRLDLLHEAVPSARRVAVLLVSEIRHQSTLTAMRATALTNGIELVPVYAESPASCAQPVHRRSTSWRRLSSTAMPKSLLP
jgi:putative ABC transport system substrate-binding protein